MRLTTLILALAFGLSACASGPEPAVAPEPAPAENRMVLPPAAEEEKAPAIESFTDLTVQDAVMVAVQQNPDLGIASARILAAGQAIAEARSGWYPRVNLGLGYVISNDPSVVFMNQLRQRDFSFDTNFNNPGWLGNWRLSAGVEWLVWDGGMRDAGEDLARLGVKLEERARDAIVNELKSAVIATCLSVYEAEEFIRVGGDSVNLVEEQLKISRTRFDAGAAQRSDVLSVEVRLAEAREALVRVENARERGITTLRNLLGISYDVPFSLRPGGGFSVPPVIEGDLAAVAKENRPELARAREAVKAAERHVGLRESEGNPTVSAFGLYALDDENLGFTLDQDSFTTGIAFDWNIFDGNRTRARVTAARVKVRAAREMERKTALMVEQDVSNANLKLSESRERIAVTEKSTEQAEEALSLIRARYENGAAQITEYLDAEVRLTGARVRDVAARYDIERATADLRRALGVCRAGLDGETGEIR